MAAPVKFVADFLTTVEALLPPTGAATASGAVRSGGVSAVGIATSAGSPPESTSSGFEAAAATIEGLLALPCLLLVCQAHREFTPPLLAGLRRLYGDAGVRAVPNALLHPSYTSDRHTVYVVRPA
jgi:hypothetical protein